MGVRTQQGGLFDRFLFEDRRLELGKQVRARWPGITVVLTSGYSHVLAADAQHGFHLLHKPYSVDALSRVLRDARRA